MDSVWSHYSKKHCTALRPCETNMAIILRSCIDHECKLTDLSDVESESLWKMPRPSPPLTPFLIYTQIFPLLMIITLFTLKVNEKGNRGLSSMRHCWSNIMRYFRTLYQVIKGIKVHTCWRQWCSTVANHHHVFWDWSTLNALCRVSRLP